MKLLWLLLLGPDRTRLQGESARAIESTEGVLVRGPIRARAPKVRGPIEIAPFLILIIIIIIQEV